MNENKTRDTSVKWITVNGNHIPIKPGQTVEEAVAERFDNFDDDNGVDRSGNQQVTPENFNWKTRYYKDGKEVNRYTINAWLKDPEKNKSKLEGVIQYTKDELAANNGKRVITMHYAVDEYGNKITINSKADFDRWYAKDRFFTYTYKEEQIEIDQDFFNNLGIKEEDVKYALETALNNTKDLTTSGAITNYAQNVIRATFPNVNVKKLTAAFEPEIKAFWKKQRSNLVSQGQEQLKRYNKTDGSNLNNVLDGANPGYRKICNTMDEYREHHYNCYKCVQALNLRRKGYAVEAGIAHKERLSDFNTDDKLGWNMGCYVEPEDGLDYYGNDWFFGEVGNWKKNYKGGLGTKSEKQRENITNIVKQAGDGAIFQCSVAWKHGSAHVFNVINEKGKVMFVDPQDGSRDCSSYFDKDTIKGSRTMLVRVDNLDIGPNVERYVRG